MTKEILLLQYIATENSFFIRGGIFHAYMCLLPYVHLQFVSEELEMLSIHVKRLSERFFIFL